MNILLLAAGQGKRFTDAGYDPKPLIDVNGEPMWEAVLKNFLNCFSPQKNEKLNVYVATKEEYKLNPSKKLKDTNGNDVKYTIVALDGPQYGAAFSALETCKMTDLGHYRSNDPLWVLNCDQFVFKPDYPLDNCFYNHNYDGALLHFIERNKEWKWGRSVSGPHRDVLATVEKIPISSYMHTGHYYFKRTDDFIKYAQEMIDRNIKVNNEFFISPIYNLMIADGKWISSLFVKEFIGIGIPEDLEKYLNETK